MKNVVAVNKLVHIKPLLLLVRFIIYIESTKKNVPIEFGKALKLTTLHPLTEVMHTAIVLVINVSSFNSFQTIKHV